MRAFLSPTKVGTTAIGLACGAGSTAMWTANGELLTMGANAFGQCGLGFASAAVELPSPVGRVGAVRGASLGFRHGLCFGSEGELWAWGKNDNGQLGLGSRASRLVPERVEALSSVRVAAAACGLSHSAALDSDGRLHVWGKMRAAEVWKERRPGLSLPRVYADALEPREIALQTSGGGYRAPRAPLKALACSNFHTVVVDARNDIWVLGLERMSREMTPKPRLLLGLPAKRSWTLRKRAPAHREETYPTCRRR